MTTIADLAHIVRSKNAGPFSLTFDILFNCRDNYEKVKNSGVINPGTIERLYGIPKDSISIYYYETANAIKITFPRKYSAGDFRDTDVYGAQQHAPLLGICIPEYNEKNNKYKEEKL